MPQQHERTAVTRTAGRPLTTLPGPRGLPLVGNLLQLKPTQLHTAVQEGACDNPPFPLSQCYASFSTLI
jgi:hypothetical protein